MKIRLGKLLLGAFAAAALTGIAGPYSAQAAVEFGWEEVNGAKYWYENWVKQGTEGRGKEIYDPESDAWYWLDSVDGGKMAVSKDLYQESEAGPWAEDKETGTGKWVRYDADGHMVKGWYANENGTYFFDHTYGTMAKGNVTIEGREYFFDEITGILKADPAPVQNGWTTIDGADYWYENGVKQGTEGRGKEIYDPASDAWYWLDAPEGKKAVSKDVYQESEAGQFADREDGTGKWVRYNAEGRMIKGWDTNENGTYYFDDTYGAMAKGRVQIDGVFYNFHRETGILEKTENECNLPSNSSYYKYEYAYRNKDLSGLSEGDMPFYEGVKAYLDYALQFDTPFLQEKAIHDYMLLNCEYDYNNYLNGTIPWESFGAAGVVVNHRAVCNGYATAFQMFMGMLGIKCEMISSGQLNHAWNRVMLDDEWYMVDVTWDDPVPDVPGRVRYRYFNLPIWLFDHEASDYTQTAEGTKWMGETIYTMSTAEAGGRIKEILQEEVKRLQKNRLTAIYVTQTDQYSIADFMRDLDYYSLQYNDAFSWEMISSDNSCLLRLQDKYDGFLEYQKMCVGDEVYHFGYEEAAEEITRVLERNVEKLDKERVFAFYVDVQNQDNSYVSGLLQSVREKSVAGNAYTWISNRRYDNKILLRMRGDYEDYETFEREFVGDEIHTVSYENAEQEILQVLKQNVKNLNKEKVFGFYITGQNLSTQDISSIYTGIRRRSYIGNAYTYAKTGIFCGEDKILIQLRGGYDNYEAFRQEYFGPNLAEVPYKGAVEAIGERLVQQGTNVDRNVKFTFLIPREGEIAGEGSDVDNAINRLVNQIRYYHPYCGMYSISARRTDEELMITVTFSYNSYQGYLEGRNVRSVNFTEEDAALQAVKKFMEDAALADQKVKYDEYYIKLNQTWTYDEQQKFRAKLVNGKYGSVYNVSGGLYGENWYMVRLSYRYTEIGERVEILNTNYDVKESEAAALIRQVMASEDAAGHSQHTFWISSDSGAAWEYSTAGAFKDNIVKETGISSSAVSYSLRDDVLWVCIYNH